MISSSRAIDLADRFKAFNDERIAFVEKCPDSATPTLSAPAKSPPREAT